MLKNDKVLLIKASSNLTHEYKQMELKMYKSNTAGSVILLWLQQCLQQVLVTPSQY